jgi:hypothetical protein
MADRNNDFDYRLSALKENLDDIDDNQTRYYDRLVSKIDALAETYDKEFRDPDTGIHIVLRKLASGALSHMTEDKAQHEDFNSSVQHIKSNLDELTLKLHDLEKTNKELQEKAKSFETMIKKLLFSLLIIIVSSFGTSHVPQIVDVIKLIAGH